jgi:hypothetical protein
VVDIDRAIGFVVAHGDTVNRARLSWLRTGAPPAPEVIVDAEIGQVPSGGWPAFWASDVASIDATCFRLAELDDLGALGRPAARAALDWLVSRQRPDGTWEEDESLAGDAPPWAMPGDSEATLYQTAHAGFWLAVTGAEIHPHVGAVQNAARALMHRLRPDGTWPSFLAAGWLSAAVLYDQGLFYESARIQAVLGERLPGMAPADVAAMTATLRRVGIAANEWLVMAAMRRLADTQRSDGGWSNDAGSDFEVHTALTVIRACR